MSSQKTVLSAAGPSAPVLIYPAASTALLAPSILCLLAAGSALTYSIEVTGDSLDATGNVPSTATWFPFDATMSGLTVSQNATLAARITAVRANVTAYTSGTLTVEVVQ